MSKYKERRQIKHTHIHPRNCYIQINIIFRNDLETFISGITLEIITLCQNFHYVKSLTHTLSPDFLPYNFAKNEFHALQKTAQGTLLNVTWQPGWEGSLGENGYMYIYGWVPLLSTWNYHNFVNWLYPQYKIKSLKFERKDK